MKKTLKPYIIWFTLFLSSAAAPPAVFSSSADVNLYVNGEYRGGITSAFIEEHSYKLRFRGPYSSGISLLEVLPLFLDVYRIEVEFEGRAAAAGDTGSADVPRNSRSEILRGGNLADRFGKWYLTVGGGAVHLLTEDRTYGELSSINIWGEEIPGDELTVWIGWEGITELKEEFARFEKLTGITLNIQEVPSIDSKLSSVARGGGPVPDLVMIQSDYLPELTKSGILQKLDYMVPEHILEKGIAAFIREGGHWGIPFYFDTQLVFYNPELVQKAPPLDWDLEEFEAVLQDLRSRGIAPITWNAYSAYWFIPFQLGFGKESILESDNSITVDDPPTQKALRYIIDLTERGLLDIREREGMMSRFLTGGVAMILSGSYSIPEFEKLGVPFAVAPYPYNRKTRKPVSPLLDFKAFGITKRTRNPVLARRVIEYLTGIGVQQRFTAAVSKLPANTEAWSIIEGENPYYDTLYKSYRAGTVIPPANSYKIYKNTMWKLLRFALTGQLTAEETLRKGQEIIDNKLKARR